MQCCLFGRSSCDSSLAKCIMLVSFAKVCVCIETYQFVGKSYIMAILLQKNDFPIRDRGCSLMFCSRAERSTKSVVVFSL